jgi:integral membrane protein
LSASVNKPRSTRTGQLFALVALAEAITWAGLLVGMFLKYVVGSTELGVWLFGRLHGGAFLLYCAVALFAAVRLRWPWWGTLLALAAAIPPLATFPLERWFRRRGFLARRADLTAGSTAI